MDIKKIAAVGCVLALAMLVPCGPLGVAVFAGGASVATGILTGGAAALVGAAGLVAAGVPGIATVGLTAVILGPWGLLAAGAILA